MEKKGEKKISRLKPGENGEGTTTRRGRRKEFAKKRKAQRICEEG